MLNQSVKLIEQGQREGSIKNGDPLALALAFWMAIEGVVENIARNPSMPIPKSQRIVDILRNCK